MQRTSIKLGNEIGVAKRAKIEAEFEGIDEPKRHAIDIEIVGIKLRCPTILAAARRARC